MEKPPLGLRPKFIWLKQRKTEIQEAVIRYFEAGVAVPIEWIEEYNDICGMLKGEEHEKTD